MVLDELVAAYDPWRTGSPDPGDLWCLTALERYVGRPGRDSTCSYYLRPSHVAFDPDEFLQRPTASLAVELITMRLLPYVETFCRSKSVCVGGKVVGLYSKRPARQRYQCDKDVCLDRNVSYSCWFANNLMDWSRKSRNQPAHGDDRRLVRFGL